MNVLIFNGAIDDRPYATYNRLAAYLETRLKERGFNPEILNVEEADVPYAGSS